MRRSEALKLITNIISEVTYENLAEKRAEKILSTLEEVGILPPSYAKAHNIPGIDTYHIWEPENDTE